MPFKQLHRQKRNLVDAMDLSGISAQQLAELAVHRIVFPLPMEKLERFGFEICGCDVGEIGHKKTAPLRARFKIRYCLVAYNE